MSLDKSVYYHKEHRKPYYDSRAFDYSCRNHGSCAYCRRNRLHKYERQALRHTMSLHIADNIKLVSNLDFE